MKKIFLLFFSTCLIAEAIAQRTDKLNKNPDERITVNKEYDENGNLIGYDSTYIHTWSSDTTVDFPFPDKDFFAFRGGFPDLGKMMKQFFDDSTFFMPFGGMDDSFFRNFHQPFSDSMFVMPFPFFSDSARKDPFSEDWFNPAPHGFSGKNPEKFRKQFENHDNWLALPDSLPGNSFFHFGEPFQDEEQMQEYKALKEKQRKEMEEFRKKWEKKNGRSTRKI